MMNKIELQIPSYSKDSGFKYEWEDNFEIEVSTESGAVQIKANTAGLRSLANHLLNLAQKEVPNQYHLHLDEYNSLEEGSLELLIQKED